MDDELLGSKAGQIQGPSSAVAMAFSPLPWCLVFLHSAACRLQTASRTRCWLLAARTRGGRQAPRESRTRASCLAAALSRPRVPVSPSPRLPDCDFMLHPPPRCRTTSSFPPSRRGTGFNHLPWPISRLATGGPHAALLSSHLRSVWCLARSLIHAAKMSLTSFSRC